MEKIEIIRRFGQLCDRITREKVIKKHEQYGNSLEEPALIFNDIHDVQMLIDVRLDDKLNRMKSLPMDNPKYWSEIEEMIAYMLWKIVLHEKEEEDESCSSNCGYEGVQIEGSQDSREGTERILQDALGRRLSSLGLDHLRKEKL